MSVCRTFKNKAVYFVIFLFLICNALVAKDYFVDPVKGSMSNPGTSDKPWSELSLVLASKKFQGGDRIWLRRGFHGTIYIRGHNSSDVFIKAVPGHTPTTNAILFDNASHWNVSGFSMGPPLMPKNHRDYEKGLPQGRAKFVNISTQENEDSHHITVSDCYGYTAQYEDAVKWSKGKWTQARGTVQNYGKHNTVKNCHWYNVKGSALNGFHSNYFTYSRNVHQNFIHDAMGQKADFGLFEYNLIMNYHIVDSNHNDGFQSYGGAPRRGTIVRGNVFIAYSDKNQPYRHGSATAHSKYCHGIGMFDGFYEDWVIENNVVFNNYQTGIWIRGAKRLKIVNNTVVPVSSGGPRLVVGAHKNGQPSEDVINENNIVMRSGMQNTFLDWERKDARLKPISGHVDAATYSPETSPTHDADGHKRPFNKKVDRGAYESGYFNTKDTSAPSVPSNVKAVVIPGYGVDISWSASKDNRKVAGYDIFLNGHRIGHKRTGLTFLHPTKDPSGSFTVKAFDYVGNLSGPSKSVTPGGPTPDPVPPPPPPPEPSPEPPPEPTPEPSPTPEPTPTPGGAFSLIGDRIGATSIQLSWKAPASNPSLREYGIVLGDNERVWKRIKTVSGSTTSVVLTGADGIKETTALLQVRAITSSGVKLEMSEQIAVAPYVGGTPEPTPTPVPEPTPTPAPVPTTGAHGLVGTRTGSTSISLSWKAPAGNPALKEYGIVLGDNERVWKRIKTVSGSTLSVNLTGSDGIKETTAQLQVRAVLKDGTKLPMSEQIQVAPYVGGTPEPTPTPVPEPTPTPAPVPTTGAHGLVGTRTGSTAISLSWNAPAGNPALKEYGIVLGDNERVWKRIKTVSGSTLSVNLTGSDGIKETTAQLQVRAVLKDGTKLPMSEQILVGPYSGGTPEPSPEPLPPPPPPSGAPVTYKAVDAKVVGAKKLKDIVDYINRNNDYIEWNVQATSAGTHQLAFLYALGYGDRPLKITVNGTVIAEKMSFPSTDNWSSFKTVQISTHLNAGQNTIRATANGHSGGDVKALIVTP